MVLPELVTLTPFDNSISIKNPSDLLQQGPFDIHVFDIAHWQLETIKALRDLSEAKV